MRERRPAITPRSSPDGYPSATAEGYFLAVNSTGTAYVQESPATVLSTIGAQPAGSYASLNTPETFTATQSAKVQALTYGTTITPNFAAGNDMSVTLTGDATLANPTGLVPGTSGHILITQDSTGSRTLAFGSYYNFGSAGVPTLSTTAGASDLVIYWVASTTSIVCAFMGGV